MTLASLASRDRRALALGGVAFAPLALWLLVVAPFTRRLDETHDRLDRSTELLGRELRIVRSARQYVAMRPVVQRRLADVQRHLVYATSDASARATLVGLVDERARASDVDVTAVDATADSSMSGALRRVAVRLSGTGDMEGILTLIARLEAGSPFLTVSEIEIEAGAPGVDPAPPTSPASDSTGRRAAAATGPERLALRLVVSAFRASGESDDRRAGGPDRVAAR